MAKDKDEKKQVDDGEDQPDKEIFLEGQERDPDEAVFAEQAIHHYADDVLNLFRDHVDAAMSELSGFFSAQTDKEELDNGFFLQELGGAFLDLAMDVFGGADSPIGRALYSSLAASVGDAAFSENAHHFCKDLKTALHDASHNLSE